MRRAHPSPGVSLSPTKQDDDRFRTLAKINAVSGTKVDPAFKGALPTPWYSRNSLFDSNESRGHLGCCRSVEVFKPPGKGAAALLVKVLPYRDHALW